MKRTSVPSSMQALVLRSYGQGWDRLDLEERPVSTPGRGKVLVRVSAAPINPSDLAFLRGLYAYRKPLPTVPGLEGSGRVVASGGGFLARRLLGKRVACVAEPGDSDGTWAQYAVTSAKLCVPLPDEVTDEQGAVALVNPFTASSLLELAELRGARAIVNTGAAGALGRMLLRLASRKGIQVVNVVRRADQVALLRSLGATHVLDSGEPDFDQRLEQICRDLRVVLAFDAIGGDMTNRLASAIPSGGAVIVYGGLSWDDCQVSPRQLIFERKTVEGFYLPVWLARKNLLQMLLLGRRVSRLLAGDLRTQVREIVPLTESHRALDSYIAAMSAGKFLLAP